MVSHGIGKLVERAFAAHNVTLDATTLDRHSDRMVAVYMADLTSRTTLMPGAMHALALCRRAGIKTGVVTNKPRAASEGIVTKLGFDALLDTVIGGDDAPNKKPHPDLLLLALDRLNVAPGDALLVGDSGADMCISAPGALPSAIAAMRRQAE